MRKKRIAVCYLSFYDDDYDYSNLEDSMKERSGILFNKSIPTLPPAATSWFDTLSFFVSSANFWVATSCIADAAPAVLDEFRVCFWLFKGGTSTTVAAPEKPADWTVSRGVVSGDAMSTGPLSFSRISSTSGRLLVEYRFGTPGRLRPLLVPDGDEVPAGAAAADEDPTSDRSPLPPIGTK